MRQPLRRGGFTLIELLVVVAIIAVLIAMMVPALKRAKEHSKAAMCLSNIRQVFLSTGLYFGDSMQRFMRVQWGNKSQIVVPGHGASEWLDIVWEYSNQSLLSLECPTQTAKRTNFNQPAKGDKRVYMPGYLINRQVNTQVPTGSTNVVAPIWLTWFKSPATKILYADSSGHDDDVPDGGSPNGVKTGRFGRNNWSPFSCLYSTNDSGNSAPVAWRHFDGPDVAYLDGHAELRKRVNVWPKFSSDPQDQLKYRTYWDPDGDGNMYTPVIRQ